MKNKETLDEPKEITHTKSQQLGSCQRMLYAFSFCLSTFDVISDILLVIQWFQDGKQELAMLLLLGILLSNIVTAISLYVSMVEIQEVIFSIFGLGSAYHLLCHIVFYKNTKQQKFWASSEIKIHHLLSLIEVQIESSISTLVQIIHITIFNSLSPIALLSLVLSLLSIGYNYPYHLYRIVGAMHSYISPKQNYLKLVCALDTVSRCMAFAVCYGLFIDVNNIWKFVIAICIFVLFSCILGTISAYKTLKSLPEKISNTITISPTFIGLALITSGGFNHSMISLSWYNDFKWSTIGWPSMEIIIRFIISMVACVMYAKVGESFASSGTTKGDATKIRYDKIMFTVCQIGCWLGLLNVIVSNVIFKCKQRKKNKATEKELADIAAL
eukprot:516715_1